MKNGKLTMDDSMDNGKLTMNKSMDNGKLKVENETKNNSQLKKGWKYGTLEDAVKKASSNISLNKVKNDEGEYPLFSAKGFNKNISFFQQEKEYLGIIKDGAGIGRVSKHPAKSSIVATMQYLIPKDGFDIGFIEYFLNGIDFEKYRNGSTIPHIYFKDYKSEIFPILSLPEQKRIVAILDRAFEAINKAKANAEQNLKNAKELFQSKLQAIFDNGKLKIESGEWVERKLGKIFKFKSGDGLTAKNMIDGVYPVFGGNGIAGYHNQYNFENEVIIGRVGALCGNVRYIKEKFWLTDNAFRISEGLDRFNYDFVVYMLNHNNLRSYARQAAQPVISNSSLKYVMILFPKSIETQKQIVAQLDKLQEETKKLERIYQQKIDDLEELKKSILSKTFRGEL